MSFSLRQAIQLMLLVASIYERVRAKVEELNASEDEMVDVNLDDCFMDTADDALREAMKKMGYVPGPE